MAAGRFRQDLLFRLNTDRDPPAAAARAARGHPAARRALPRASTRSATASRSPASIAGALQALLDHRWPGNVRELDHAVERAVLMAQGDADSRRRPRPAAPAARRRGRLDDMSLEEVEAFLIRKAMARYGNVSHAARRSA